MLASRLTKQGNLYLDEGEERMFGRAYAECVADFVARTAGEQAPNISLCVIKEDSTVTRDHRCNLTEPMTLVRPTASASHGLTQYHSEFFHRLRSVLRSPSTQELDGGPVHRGSLGNQTGICLLLFVGDGVRNGRKRASAMHD